MGDIKLFIFDGDNADELEGQSVAVEKSLQHIIKRHLKTFLRVNFYPPNIVQGNATLEELILLE